MKKTLQLLAVTFLTILLTACNIQTVEQYEKIEEQERSVNHSPTNEKIEQHELSTDSDYTEAEHEKGNTTQQEEKPQETKTEESRQQQANEPETQKTTTEKPDQSVTKQELKANEQTEQTQPQSTEITEQQVEQSQKKRSVTIAIYVNTLLNNFDLLDPSLQSEKYVPKNGVILKATTYELLSENDTVWDILQRATKEHKIQIEYQGANKNIYNSVYIEGINHIYELSAGPLSGWMYKVNDVYPNYGSGQYTLKDGDVIEWHYTVDLGRDLGQEWTGEQ